MSIHRLVHGAESHVAATRVGITCLAMVMTAFVVVASSGAGVSRASGRPATVPHANTVLSTATTSISITVSLSGLAGDGDWFRSPVTATLLSSDPAAGASMVYRVDQGAWLTYTTPMVISADGHHLLEYYVVDTNGAGPAQAVDINIDAITPSSSIAPIAAYQADAAFELAWTANDAGSSGLRWQDVQYRDGAQGTWQDWITHTTMTSATFDLARRGHVYHFRSRARDVAGNQEEFASDGGDVSTFVDSVSNGRFETGDFSGWTVSGEMSKTIALSYVAGGSGEWSALLGSPLYGDGITSTESLHVPTDTMASIAQTMTVPALMDMPAPVLHIWYRIQTYDVVWGCSEPDRLYDSFDVSIRSLDSETGQLTLRDGNFDCANYEPYLHPGGIPLRADIVADRVIDLSAYAGRSIVVQMHNANRQDWSYNTWTYVDGIGVYNQPVAGSRISIPVVLFDYAPPSAPPALPTPVQRQTDLQRRR